MKKDQHISEEQLNAFIDGELDSEERSDVFSVAEQSPELEQRLCQQRRLKELVQHAYREVPEPNRLGIGQNSRNSSLLSAIAAMVLLTVGFAFGALIQNRINSSVDSDSALSDNSVTAIPASENYLVHVVSGDPAQMKLALEKANELLNSASESQPRRVEVIANDKGINLLRSDTTLFSSEISSLSEREVVFYACSRAIHLLEEKGIEVHLVPEANSDFTALDRVVVRMKDGWNYIKI